MSSEAEKSRKARGGGLQVVVGRLKASPWAQMVLAAALVLAAVFGLCRVSGLSGRLRPLPLPTSTATILPTATAGPTSVATSTPTVTATATETPVPVVMVGATVEVRGTGSDQLRMRAGPGLNQELLLTVPDGTRLLVIEGPEQADGYNWWKARTEDAQEGWAASDWLVPVAAQ